jgi:hypothetical protein
MEDEYQFIISSLANKIHSYEEMMETARESQPLTSLMQSISN